MTRSIRERISLRSLIFAAVVACVFYGQAAPALARPGGGSSFSGGGFHSSGGGFHSSGSSFHSSGSSFHSSGSGFTSHSGGGDQGSPVAGAIVTLGFVLMFFWIRAKVQNPESWESGKVTGVSEPQVQAVDLAPLLALDPEFSRIVFEDFAYRLYASVMRVRHDARALGGLAPYLSAALRSQLVTGTNPDLPATNVIVAALRIARLSVESDTVELSVDYVSNVTTGPSTTYLHERWVMVRAASARTKPPEETERLGCPNCAAPFESSDGRRCTHCGQVVSDGRFAWQVVSRSVLERRAVPPALTSTVEERGTDLPSVFDPAHAVAWKALCDRDPSLNAAGLTSRVSHIYNALNTAWCALELESVRGCVSDGLYDYLRYWTEAYANQGLRNRLEDMQIKRMLPVKVTADKHFDAVTLRLWGNGFDYTVNASDQRVVTGSNMVRRDYSEYWTLIRGANTRGAARADANCPSCAAPLRVSMAGNCEHCGSHVTRGEFDWVLSKIEQDDVYAG